MDLYDLILTRRSIRTYTKQSISDDLIHELLDAAMVAPSAGNQQPWDFIVIDDPKVLEKASQFLPNGKLLKDANKGILICGDLNRETHKNYWMLDCSASTQNILLAAHAKGIGACWLGVYPRPERIEGLSKLFNTPKHIIPFTIISLGYTDEESGKVNRFDKSRIHINKW